MYTIFVMFTCLHLQLNNVTTDDDCKEFLSCEETLDIIQRNGISTVVEASYFARNAPFSQMQSQICSNVIH